MSELKPEAKEARRTARADGGLAAATASSAAASASRALWLASAANTTSGMLAAPTDTASSRFAAFFVSRPQLEPAVKG